MIRSLLSKLKRTTHPEDQISLLKQISTYYIAKGFFPEVKKYSSEGLSLFTHKDLSSDDYFFFLHAKCIALNNLGEYASAVPLLYDLEQMSIETDRHHYTAEANRILGIIYAYMKNFTDSEKKILKSLRIALDNALVKETALAYNAMFIFYRHSAQLDKAHEALQQGIPYAETSQDLDLISLFYNNTGLYFHLSADYKTSIQYYKKSLAIKKKLRNAYGISVSSYNLGTNYDKLGKHTKSVAYYLTACKYAEKANNVNILMLIYERLAEHYERQEDFKSAIDYYKKKLSVSKIIYDMKRNKLVMDLETRHELENKEKEAEIYRLKNIELAEAYQKIESQNESLRHLNISKDFILHIVSHDLKNSIGIMRNVITLIHECCITDASLLKYLTIIEQASEQSMALVQAILQKYTIDMDSFTLLLKPYDLNHFFKNYAELLFFDAYKKELDVNISLLTKESCVMLDTERFYQIMLNLITNAVKFTHRGGALTLSIEKDENNTHVILTDTGIGITPDELPYIFDKFSTARKKGTEQEPTTGLGLSIVKRLIELHNAEIHVCSTPHRGTAIKLSFHNAECIKKN